MVYIHLRVAFCIQACCGTYATVPCVLIPPPTSSISPRSAESSEDLPVPTDPTTATNSPFETFILTEVE